MYTTCFAGRAGEYFGEAVNPKNLSVYEGLRKVGRHYKNKPSHDRAEVVDARTKAASEAVKRNAATQLPIGDSTPSPLVYE